MIDRLLSYIAPHPCCGCGKTGRLLCDNCKYNISNETFSGCIVCRRLTNQQNLCQSCRPPYSRSWCVGERTAELRRLIDAYKFENTKAAHTPLAELLARCVEQLPPSTIVVPVPTVSSHIRARGYDHTLLLARTFARQRGLVHKSLIQRATSTKQRDASRQVRVSQAKMAFAVNKKLNPDVPYLLIDDIVTTGATLYYAATALQAAGARTIWTGVIARQPLD